MTKKRLKKLLMGRYGLSRNAAEKYINDGIRVRGVLVKASNYRKYVYYAIGDLLRSLT